MTEHSLSRLRQFLRATRGKIMTVEFVKKNGDLRRMICRTGVKKHLKDPTGTCSPKLIAQDIQHGLLRVFDMEKRAYRMVNLATLQKIQAGGEEFKPGAARTTRIRSWFLGGAA